MKHFIPMKPEHHFTFTKNSLWFTLWGCLLIALGIFSISYANVATLVSVIFLGALLSAGGLILVLDSFLYWRQQWSAFFLHFVTGLFYLAVGYLLMRGPEIASLSITLLLAFFYIVLGALRLCYSVIFELPGHWLRMLNGLITLILGLLILMAWPASGLFIIGLFIGIDLIFLGFVYLLTA